MYEGYRQIELLIGPFEEGELRNPDGTPKARGSALSILSNGSLNTMRVQASISKSIFPMSNTANIIIWNLAADTINRLRKPGMNVQILAGYENGNMEVVFSGGIGYVKAERQGPDIVTTLICRTGGMSMLKSAVSISYSGDTSVQTIVTELAQKIPGVTVDPTKIKIKGKIGYAGFSYVGGIEEALNKLAYQYGFTWNVDDGIFVTNMDGEAPRLSAVLDEKSGLRRVSPQLYGLFQIQTGWDIESEYVQGVRPGTSIKVKSLYEREINGGVHSVNYNLCPKTSQWDMNISILTFFGSDFS